MSEVVVWTDFKRINQTHFWSPNRKIYIEPAITHVYQIMGDRKISIHLIIIRFYSISRWNSGTFPQKLKVDFRFLMEIGSGWVSFKIIYEVLQSELFRFKLNSMRSKFSKPRNSTYLSVKGN